MNSRYGSTMDGRSGWQRWKRSRLNGVANGIGVNAQFTGDGADLPMLGIKIAANLRRGFRD